MTMWFDDESEELVQNRADLHVTLEDDEMRLDLSDEHIREEFLKVADTVMEYNIAQELAHDDEKGSE